MGKDRKGPKGQEALDEIEARLGGLFGNLGNVLKDVIDLAQSDKARGDGGFERSFDLSNGPIRAQSAFRVRVGGLGGGQEAGDRDITTPVNDPPEAKPRARAARTDELEPNMDIFLDQGAWVLTAEVPGIPEDGVEIWVSGQVLEISATGAMSYRTQVAIPDGLDPDSLRHSVTNGILELRGRVSTDGTET